MTKKCAIQGCNREINQWATYCQQHYNQVMEQKARQGQAMPQQQPHVPTNIDLLNSYPAMPEMNDMQVEPTDPNYMGSLQTENYTAEPVDDINDIVEDNVIVQEPPRIPRQGMPMGQMQQQGQAMPMQGQQQMPFQYQEQMQQQPQQRPQRQRQARPLTPRFDMPNLTEEQRLEIKKVAFTGALNFMITQDLAEQPFEGIIEQVRTLTAEFYRVMAERNENAPTR